MKMMVESWRCSDYVSVWKVVSYKDGCIFRAKDTGKSILSSEQKDLPEGYFPNSYSTSLTKLEEFEIDVVPVNFFK